MFKAAETSKVKEVEASVDAPAKAAAPAFLFLADRPSFKHYQFYDHAGNIHRYPVAAYAAVYSEEIDPVPFIYSWLDKQPQPIRYDHLIAYFRQIAAITREQPPVVNINYRAMIQLIAILGQPVSASSVRELFAGYDDVSDNAYGVTIGAITDRKKQEIVAELEKNNIFISNTSQKYDGKHLIWVVGASICCSPSEADLEHPVAMQKYWKKRADFLQGMQGRASNLAEMQRRWSEYQLVEQARYLGRLGMRY